MYQNAHVRAAVAAIAGLQISQIFLNYNGSTFDLALPPGVVWEDREPQPDLEIPQVDEEGNPLPPILQSQPDIVTPKPIWDWYRAEYEGLAEEPPSAEAVAAWEMPEQEQPQNPVTDVEILYKTISERLNGDEAKRTGRPVDPNGAVPVARAMAATAMLYQRWHYPSEADLSTGNNPALLQVIYADPTANTTETSSVDQKRRVLHFTLVMLEGQAFGLEYQAELGAYERTASGAFLAKLALDKRDWLDLPVHTWPSVRAMFADLMG